MTFREYEKQVDVMIANRRSIILCSYPLATSPGDQVFDIAHLHQVAVARRNGSWEMIEIPELKEAKAEIKRLNDELEQKVKERTNELVTTNDALRSEIAERKLAEEAVRQAENRLRRVIDTIPTMVWSLGPDGILDFINQRWLDYAGLSFEDAIEEPTRTMHPEERPRAMEKWLKDMAAGELYEEEMRLRRADGQYRWFLVRTAPLRDTHGNIVKWYGASIDIEDRKQAEMQSRALIDAIPQQIWTGPPDGTLDYCNDRWRAYMGLGLEELRGDGWQAMLHPEERDRVLKAWYESVANGTPYEQEERHRRTDGTYRWFLSRGVPLRDAEGRIIRWYGTNTDIEDRKRAEERLRKVGAQLADAQRVAHIGSWEWDITTGTVTWSDEKYRIMGMEPQEVPVTYSSFLNGLHPDDRARVDEAVQQALRDHQPFSHEYRAILPKGEVRLQHVEGSVVTDESGRVVRMFGTVQDITERKTAERQIEHFAELFQALSHRLLDVQEEERRHLARELHDEIGQTLTAAKLNLKIIASEVPPAVAGRLADSMQILDHLLQQVRQLSLDLRPPLLDELGLVPALRWLADQQAQRAQLRVPFTANVELLELDPSVRTACFRIAQEAITNAIRHASAKTVAVELRQEADGLWLSVRDDGVGFDPSAVQEQAGQGASIGLLSMKERVLLLGGELEVSSAPGHGTEIRAWFPLAPPGPEVTA
jgi:PAS domain S-box-containing protein